MLNETYLALGLSTGPSKSSIDLAVWTTSFRNQHDGGPSTPNAYPGSQAALEGRIQLSA